MKITKRRLRKIIKEERTKLLKEQSRASSEGELIANLAMAIDELGGIHDEMYGLVLPGPQKARRSDDPTYGDELARRLQTELDNLNSLADDLNAYFETVDDLAGRNPGGSIG